MEDDGVVPTLGDLIREAMRGLHDRPHPPARIYNTRNTAGRDFVVGDLHGCYSQLMEKLDLVKFDPGVDRLFSVGDLADRGPESLRCLRLLREPWFFAVLGNHEAMLLQALGLRNNIYTRARDFTANGGHWLRQHNDADQCEIFQIAEQHVLDLPLRRTVSHEAGDFDVVHAQYHHIHPLKDSLEYSDKLEILMTWGRSLVTKALKDSPPEIKTQITELHYAKEKRLVEIPPVMVKRRLTYAGHTIVRVPIKTRSHVFLDTGAYESEAIPGFPANPYRSLTLIEHASQEVY